MLFENHLYFFKYLTLFKNFFIVITKHNIQILKFKLILQNLLNQFKTNFLKIIKKLSYKFHNINYNNYN